MLLLCHGKHYTDNCTKESCNLLKASSRAAISFAPSALSVRSSRTTPNGDAHGPRRQGRARPSDLLSKHKVNMEHRRSPLAISDAFERELHADFRLLSPQLRLSRRACRLRPEDRVAGHTQICSRQNEVQVCAIPS